MNFELICKEVESLVRQAGQFIQEAASQFRSGDIETKSENNFVSWVDKGAEQMLVEGLRKILPGSGFIVEESTTTEEILEYTWIIDPLDGTTNFIHAVPIYCVSVGLMHKNVMVLGIILEVNSEECFYAWEGGGAWMNGKAIQVTKTETVKDSLLATGFPYYDYGRLEPFIELLRYTMQNTHGIRRLGSAAADLAWVACGRFDGFYEYGLSPWDVAAGIVIIREAGGVLSDFEGKDNYLFGKEIIATNPRIFKEFLEVVKTTLPHLDHER
ncbi:MAG: inositol monophosphatase family protein [Bacteroidota bacterium]